MNILFVILFINGHSSGGHHSSSGDSSNGHHTSTGEGTHISKIDWNTNGNSYNSINKNMFIRVITTATIIHDIELMNSFKNLVEKTKESHIYNITRFNNYTINYKKYRCLYYYKTDTKDNSEIIFSIDLNTTYSS